MKIRFIKFNDHPWDEKSEEYHPELVEVLLSIVFCPFFFFAVLYLAVLWLR